MTNFSINFTHPWLLLLLIPAFALTLVPYFLMNKKYRKTRNRIVSMVLHAVIMILSVSILAGISFDYDRPNTENEVILLVDTSFSGAESENDKNEFIKSVAKSSNARFKLGVVTFGFNQVYAVEMTDDTTDLYSKYLSAEKPDDTATDIEAALNYAAGLFKTPETARIVLITDAVETDGTATNTIKSIAAQGIKVDTVYFPEERNDDEVRLVGIEHPDEKIKVGEKFNMKLAIESNYEGEAIVTPYDNSVAGLQIPVRLKEGMQYIEVPFEFTLPGMHEMNFEITANGDTLVQNNIYNSFVYLEIFDRVLILESQSGESNALVRMLKNELQVTVMNIGDVEGVPETVDELREYDEVVLLNISNADMPTGFIDILNSFVYDYGGGVFTVCGNKPDANPGDEEWTANAYTREDMYGKLYQEMLPVEVIEYTPPAAVMILIDCSGSMVTYPDNSPLPDNENKLIFAKEAAIACVDLLSERDYVGILSLAEDFVEHLPLTARTQRDKILASIEHIEAGTSTIFSTALEHAGKSLAAMSGVEKRHIIIITDGEPSSADSDRYKTFFQENAEMGITTSVIGVRCENSAKSTMKSLLTNYAGMTEESFHDVDDLKNPSNTIAKDFEVSKIQEVNYEKFTPTIVKDGAVTKGIKQEDMPELDGFYGLKLKEGAEVILSGRFTPIYAQWQYGKGRVGTFACDLNGTWSSSFIDTPTATTLVNNIVEALFPTESVRSHDVEIKLDGKNYKLDMDIYTELLEGQYIELTVTSPAVNGGDETVQKFTAGIGDRYSRMSFAITTPGIHTITVRKLASDGTLISERVVYREFSYSQEYNPFNDEEVAKALIVTLADSGRGVVITEPYEVFENAAKVRHIHIDPRIVFMIIAIVLFLLDIAVRKFKWKWIHELVREAKEKKVMDGKRG